MVKSKKIDYSTLSRKELLNKLTEFKKELFNLRFAKASGELEKPFVMRSVRRNIARVMTFLNMSKTEKV